MEYEHLTPADEDIKNLEIILDESGFSSGAGILREENKDYKKKEE